MSVRQPTCHDRTCTQTKHFILSRQTYSGVLATGTSGQVPAVRKWSVECPLLVSLDGWTSRPSFSPLLFQIEASGPTLGERCPQITQDAPGPASCVSSMETAAPVRFPVHRQPVCVADLLTCTWVAGSGLGRTLGAGLMTLELFAQVYFVSKLLPHFVS